MSTYQVNEIFRTLQGEGYWTGRAAVFCRFSRCNLWTGHEKDRHRAVCQFCDTDFTHADKYDDHIQLADAIEHMWGVESEAMVVLTGGEPLLQVDAELTAELKSRGFYIAVETNGTQPRPAGIDWVCVSPKVNAELVLHGGDELKLVYPQGPDPSVYLALRFQHFWLSPMDGPELKENTAAAVDYIHRHPKWRLSIQTHKVLGLK